MVKINLNGKFMTDKEQTHRYLKQEFNFPQYYGNNLDALWDCLTDIMEETTIILKNEQSLKDNLGEYGEQIISIFQELEEEYLNFKFEIIS